MRHAALLALAFVLALARPTSAAEPRARDLGIPFDFGSPGRWNAITDVAGVEVGHVTLVEGDAVRTGVTAVLPRGHGESSRDQCFGGWFSLNGNGEMTGTAWLEESGLLEGPVMITNTNSVGVVRDAVISYAARRWGPKGYQELWSLPVVAETWDGHLNDIYGMHVKADHAVRAIESAASGPVAEGGVGGGTGMICYEFKGGIGTASRVLDAKAGGHTVGVLVQANFGRRPELTVAGVPVGREIADLTPEINREAGAAGDINVDHEGSVIVVIATDAPLSSRQLERLAQRAALGLARTGSTSGNTSGDIFIAFSTGNTVPQSSDSRTLSATFVSPESTATLNPLFQAVVEATEESVLNALMKAETMTGINGNKVHALPYDRLKAAMSKYGR